MSDTDNTQHIEYLRELAALEHVPVGTRVLVHEDGIEYAGAGNIATHITDRLGIPSTSVWIPAHVSLPDIRYSGL